MTVRANERIVFMKHYRLDFGTFIHHENGIFEAIVDDGIELSEEMVKEFFELIKSIEPKIKLCLVNRKNRYSYSFKANFMLASSKLADYVAVVKNGGCKKFCVNGHLAGNCRHFERSRNDRSKSTTPRPDRQPAVWL